MKETINASFSGGETSAFMVRMLKEKYRDKYNISVVFANTGEENEETLEFIKKCDDEFGFNTVWIESISHHEKGKGQLLRTCQHSHFANGGRKLAHVPARRHACKPFLQRCINKYIVARASAHKSNDLACMHIRSGTRQRMDIPPPLPHPPHRISVGNEEGLIEAGAWPSLLTNAD